MEIKEIKLADIKPYENNPRFNDEAVDAVAESIQQFGFKVPIVIDKNGVIVTGHTRYKAAKAMSMDKVPCILADDLTEDQVKAFRIADNKVGEIATWDIEKLEKELLDIDMDMSEFGFDLNVEEEITPIEDDFEEYPEKLTKVGQLWQLGRHFLKVGDSTEPSDLEDLVGGGGNRPTPHGSSI